MNTFTKTILGSVLVLGSLFTGSPALAEYEKCGNIAGYPVCAIDREYIDSLTIRWTDGDYSHIGVRCGTGEWELSGYNPGRGEVNTIVRNWCY